MRVGQFPREEEQEADDGDHREHDDLRRGEPVELLAFVDHDLQRADPQHEEAEADGVERHAPRPRIALAVDRPGDAGGDEADGDVDVEDPRP